MNTYHGKPCKYGHTERYIITDKCAECRRKTYGVRVVADTYQGAPCRKGHTERYAAGNSCVACKKASQKKSRSKLYTDGIAGRFAALPRVEGLKEYHEERREQAQATG